VETVLYYEQERRKRHDGLIRALFDFAASSCRIADSARSLATNSPCSQDISRDGASDSLPCLDDKRVEGGAAALGALPELHGDRSLVGHPQQRCQDADAERNRQRFFLADLPREKHPVPRSPSAPASMNSVETIIIYHKAGLP